MESNQRFPNPDRITVGLASDVAVQVRCTKQRDKLDVGVIQWNYAVNGSDVGTGLKAFGTSQENGVLRVYPVNVLTGQGGMFQCSDGNTTLNVTFDVGKSAPSKCSYREP